MEEALFQSVQTDINAFKDSFILDISEKIYGLKQFITDKEEEKKLFQNYTNSYNEFLSMSVADSFISGFRLGAKFTHDVFVK